MYLVFDVETGGLTEDTSLLTAYFAVFDTKFRKVDELSLSLIPDDGIYKVNPKALAVNYIDLRELGEKAITYKEAKTVLYDFLRSQHSYLTAVEDKLTPVGQNIQFDIKRITDNIISEGSWESFVSRRTLDTMVLARFCQLAGKLQGLDSISLSSMVKYFGIEAEGMPHEAKFDALATMEVYRKLRDILLHT